MLILAGIALVAEGQFSAIILIAAGLIWLILKYVRKKNTAQNVYQPPVQLTEPVGGTSANFCSSCGKKLAPGVKFCPNCGNKL